MAQRTNGSNHDRDDAARTAPTLARNPASGDSGGNGAKLRLNRASALLNHARHALTALGKSYIALATARPLVFSLITVVPMLVASILIFRPSYDTNDDPTMNLIVAGKSATAEPDEHMIFTHVAIGLVLKSLYERFPELPWYGLYLFAAQALAHIALLYALITQDNRLRTLVLFLLYSSVVGVLFLGVLQFTTTAFLVGQSGLFLAILAFFRAADQKTREALNLAAAAAALLLFSSMIRWPVFFLVVCLAAPIALVLAWCYRHEKRLVAASAGLVIATTAAAYGLVHLNHAYYAADPRWKDFYEFNELRAKFNDLAWVYYSSETAPVLAANGWSANDLGMIMSWFYDDPVTFGPERLQRILDSYPWSEGGYDVVKLHEFFTEAAADRRLIPLLCLLPVMYLALGRSRRLHLAVLLTVVFVVALITATIILRKPPPARVYLPVLAFPSALALFCSAWHARGSTSHAPPHASIPPANWQWNRVGWSFVVSLSVMLGLYAGILNILEQYDRGKQRRRQSNHFYEQLAQINPQPDKLYVCWGPAMPFEHIRPTDNLQCLSGFRALHMGWPQQCPFHEDMKERFEVPYLARQLYERSNVILIAHPACLKLYANYVREHFSAEIRFELLGEFAEAVLARASPTDSDTVASQRTHEPQ